MEVKNINAGTGVFSVGKDKKVRFSMGNLQYNRQSSEWRFAEHQYDTLMKLRKDDDDSKNLEGWIDEFSFGHSGYIGLKPSEEFSKYSFEKYKDLDISNTNYDWGIFNKISNGGNKEGLWRTLTQDEWKYLLEKRCDAGERLRALACVNNVNGYVLIPDDFYERHIRIPFDWTVKEYVGNTYDLTQWTAMEKEGAVFLPINWSPNEKFVSNGYVAIYWASNCHVKLSGRYVSYIEKQYYTHEVQTGYYETKYEYLYPKFGVRLVHDIE